MSFLDDVTARMAGAVKAVKAITKSPTTVFTTRFDERSWKDVRKMPKVDSLVRDLDLGDSHRGGTRDPFDRAPELAHDTWALLYKIAPRVREKEEVERESYAVRAIAEEMSTLPQMEELRQHTAGDALLSGAALEAMAGAIREIVGRIPPPPPPPQDKEGDGEGDQGDNEEDGEGDPEQDWRDAYDEAIAQANISLAASRALDDAGKEVEKLEQVIDTFGLEAGEWRNGDPAERLKVLEQLRNPRLQALAELVGVMKRFRAGARATRIVDVPEEVYDIEMGNDLSRVLPSQFALLAREDTKYEFARRYVSRSLLQFKLRGQDTSGRGPVVAAVDKSGSMHGARMDWAVAVMEALRQAATEESRDYAAFFFGANDDRNRFDFPGGKASADQILTYLGVEADGGTQYDGVLTEALKVASESYDSDGKGRADIVFITDGRSALHPEWVEEFNKERARVGVRIFSIYIGGAGDMAGRTPPTELLKQISDYVIPVSDLSPKAATTIFERI